MAHSSFKLINAKQAAKIICCQPNHVYTLARADVLTQYYIGVRSYRLEKKEVINFANSKFKP